MKLRLRHIKPVHIEAGLSPDDSEYESFEVAFRVIKKRAAFVFGTFAMQSEEQRIFIGVSGQVLPEDFEALSEVDEESWDDLAADSAVAYVLYDTAALVARQIVATLGLAISVPTEIVSPEIHVGFHDQSDLSL